ncbi:MAG: toll/interleukin-1 receptor domain-containing protein [Bacilli bacterium]|nr:toll/interleukin-1 receptor domain-containing protein [Bacilli bacterium]
MDYKYDAFISYRHCELDKFVAENLHKILETYDLPKNVKEKLGIKGKTIRRVFRDQDELPLSSNLEDPIVDALKNSKYLIVICSPRLKESLWCKKEIQTFKKLRGRKNIFCVLVEGEPSDSFPEEVLFDEEEITLKNGKKKKEKILVEPLAADVRGKNRQEVLKKLRAEKLRLIAPMYLLDYDDLKQRHKQRKQKRIITTSIIVASFLFLFAIYTSAMLIKINSQKNTLRLHQAETLSKKARESLKNDNRYDAIKYSYQALTEFDGVNMPYTSEAEYELVESLGLYDVGSSYKSVSELKTDGIATIIKSSNNNEYGLVYDESESLSLFNTKTMKKIEIYNVSGITYEDNSFCFIGDDKFAYINEKGNINICTVKDGKLVKEIYKKDKKYMSVTGNENYLSYLDSKNLYIYDVKEDKEIGNISTEDKYIKKMYYSDDNNYLFVSTTSDEINLDEEDYIQLHVIDLKEAKEINSTRIDASSVSGMITKNGNLYMLLNRLNGTEYDMYVVSYDYISDSINWTKSFESNFGKFISKSYPEDINHIVVANYQTVRVLDGDNGELLEVFNLDSEIINLYSYYDKELYLAFLNDGSVNYLSMDTRKIIENLGLYDFNLDDYSKVTISKEGFLLIPNNDNRVILYETNSNKEIKKEDIELDYVKDDSIKISDYDKIKEEYKIKNKSLVEKIFYDDKKEVLFVNYTNKDLAIYSVKDKELLNKIEKLGKVNHYFEKDKYNRIYIGDSFDSYILEDYEKVGHIKNLRKLEKDKVYISNNDQSYSIKIYNLDEALEEAKSYLK